MKITNNKEQLWELMDELVKKEMGAKGGALKRGWKEHSVMDIRV